MQDPPLFGDEKLHHRFVGYDHAENIMQMHLAAKFMHDHTQWRSCV
jgi:hypothetical protein